MKSAILLVIGLWILYPGQSQAGPFEIEFEQLKPGIWAGIRPDSSRFPVMGNTTFVISDSGVVVFDGGGVPVVAEQLIAKIRELTPLPVTHVIISHWHGDHHFGIHRFLEEFPNVQVVAHSFTHAAMNGSPIDYILGYPDFVSSNRPRIEQMVETGLDSAGNRLSDQDLANYKRTLGDADEINAEYQRVKVTQPNVIFDDKLVIQSGDVRIELMKLGHGNTEGDIIMWLPQAMLAATGDLVVAPSPYAFNTPPRPWAQSLRHLKDLNFETLVPGHGTVQRDSQYVNLLIEVADSIADQRDRLIATGLDDEAVQHQLDFSAFEPRFTQGDAYKTIFYKAWFERPFRQAAIKALGDEPMVSIGPRKSDP